MIQVAELQEWLATLKPHHYVGVDEGGLTLTVNHHPEVYLEVGGIPEDEDPLEEAENERRLEEAGECQ
jgi:hypothetical protein